MTDENRRAMTSAARGSARVPRAGFGVAPKQFFLRLSLPLKRGDSNVKSAIARTCSPARGTRALPKHAICALAAVLIFALSASSFAQADPASEPAVLAVAKVLPAVVNINTERVVRRTVRDPFEDVYAQFFGYNRIRPRQIRQTLQSLGSGFIIDPGGYIVTNQHVVERAADLKIHVTTNDGKTYNAHYIAGDDKTDLAFIKIDAQSAFPFISLDNISPNLLGQTVIVVGNAVGYGSSISRGVLSAAKRNITVDDTEYKDLVQTDAAINPGNSGGPVIDVSGRLVGIASAKMAFTPQGVPTQGLGFAIPAQVVRESVNRFKKTARIQPTTRPAPVTEETSISNAEKLFGMQLQNLSQELSDALGYAKGRGVLIAAVEPGSPVDEAGAERGLVIYRVGKYDVSSVKQVEELLRSVDSGADVEFTVGVIGADGKNRQLANVSLKAR
ncbi:MAG: serine protease [Verrucomicrobia bacterium]|nr:MAG: serine protease [Verrucomicrobiota bacterium]PYJ35821.1 MAG: serine protease [Verrucomicrobiota bacterium]